MAERRVVVNLTSGLGDDAEKVTIALLHEGARKKPPLPDFVKQDSLPNLLQQPRPRRQRTRRQRSHRRRGCVAHPIGPRRPRRRAARGRAYPACRPGERRSVESILPPPIWEARRTPESGLIGQNYATLVRA